MYLTPDKFAEVVGVSHHTVRHWLRTKQLEGNKVSNQWRISSENLRDFLDLTDEGVIGLLEHHGININTIVSQITQENTEGCGMPNPSLTPKDNDFVVYTVRNSNNTIVRTFVTQDLAIAFARKLGDDFHGEIVMSIVLHELPKEENYE